MMESLDPPRATTSQGTSRLDVTCDLLSQPPGESLRCTYYEMVTGVGYFIVILAGVRFYCTQAEDGFPAENDLLLFSASPLPHNSQLTIYPRHGPRPVGDPEATRDPKEN